MLLFEKSRFMRRFAFSRLKKRSVSSSESMKDTYDPDQRPITISSYQRTRNKTAIVKPRIYTSNFITNRSSIANDYEDTQNNINYPTQAYSNIISINEIDDEYNFADSNLSQFNHIQTELPSPTYSKDFVAVQLPSYINPEELSLNGEEDTRNYSIYSPPEIKSPTNSRYNTISRFINSSQQINRLGRSYSSQTNRSLGYNGSRITIIDTYKEIAQKTFKNNNSNDSNNNDSETKEFLAQYLLDHTKHENAKIIQKAFRLARNRNHFNRFIRINMTINYNLKKLTFCLWRLTTATRTDQLIHLFKTVKGLYNFIIAHFKISEFAPFRLFYVTEQLFIPYGYTAESIYKFFYLMHFNMMGRVFRIWVNYTKNHAKHRKSLLSTRFAGKKFSKFGFIYHIFINWHRLSRWRVEARLNTKKKYILLNDLKKHEVNIFWNVREHILNVKRSRIKRATEFSMKRIAAKAVKALYNRSIEASSEKTIVETADMFRNLHLQTLAHRGWLKFMQKRLQELQILRETMNAWYTRVYVIALKKTEVELAEKLYIECFITKVMNAWFRQARERKIRRIGMSLRIHKRPSSMFFVIFALQNDFDLAFHALCFRMWIRLARTRKRWHLFARWCTQASIPTSSVAEKEMKIIVLSDLRRAAHLKIIKRGCSSTSNYLPRHTWMSVELAFLALNHIKFIQNNREIDFNSTNKIFKDEKENKTWQFLTEIANENQSEKTESIKFTSDILTRCFLMKLQSTKNYEMTKIKENLFVGNINPNFNQFRTLDQLEDQSDFNTSLLRKHTIEKVRRDHATLASLLSHISATKIQNTIKEFSTTKFDFDGNEITVKTKYNKCDNYNSLRTPSTLEIGEIFVYPEVNESVELLIKENDQSQNRLSSKYEQIKEKVMYNFQKRLRNPNALTMASGASTVFTNQDLYTESSAIPLDAIDDENENESSLTINLSQTNLISSSIASNFSMLNPGSATGSPMKMKVQTPIKNPLINSFVKPSLKNSSENLMMSLLDESSARNSSSSSFTIENFKRILEKFHTQEDITQSLVIFFNNVCKVQLDVSDVKSLSKPLDLLPRPQVGLNKKKSSAKFKKVKNKKDEDQNNREKNANTSLNNQKSQIDFANAKKEEEEAEIIIQTHRHTMQKNMNVFIAELIGDVKDLDHIPLKMVIPQNIENCISAIFTVFNALKKIQNLSQYLDLTPFSKKLKSTDKLLIATQDKTWISLKSAFPKIELPTETNTLMSLGTMTRRRSTISSSLFAIGNIQNIDEVMGSNDAFLACYLLPYILSFDSVSDFIKDEMKANQ